MYGMLPCIYFISIWGLSQTQQLTTWVYMSFYLLLLKSSIPEQSKSCWNLHVRLLLLITRIIYWIFQVTTREKMLHQLLQWAKHIPRFSDLKTEDQVRVIFNILVHLWFEHIKSELYLGYLHIDSVRLPLLPFFLRAKLVFKTLKVFLQIPSKFK